LPHFSEPHFSEPHFSDPRRRSRRHARVSSSTRQLAALAGGSLIAGTLVHMLPGVATLRRFRCLALPTLSGVGRADHVALTFDDGPDPASTPAFLDALDTLPSATAPAQLGWKATFFLLGEQVRRHPDLAAEVVRRGHEIGVHGFEHRNHLTRTAWWTTDDLHRATDTIGEATGQAPRWFRPPYGALSASSLVAAQRAGLPTVLWTSWGRDWRAEATAQTVVDDITATWRRGATVLLHDSDITSAPQSWRAGLAALPVLAQRWSAGGLSVGTLGEHGIGHRRRNEPVPAWW
jgi:peptidoglycan-N-acetylglucosamine deacetylase